MSINVTVNGNPMSVNRGRMITCDQETEFGRRRKIRLQQVRQQSKEIAADVRNRVKQEKQRQFLDVENQTEKDIQKYQARKLQTLQKNYEDCNRKIGAAHKNASIEPDAIEVLNEIARKNNEAAEQRSKIANKNMVKEETQRQNEIQKSERRRKYCKDIEKTRANLVVQIKKQNDPKINFSKKRKKNPNERKHDLNDTFNSDIENISVLSSKKLIHPDIKNISNLSSSKLINPDIENISNISSKKLINPDIENISNLYSKKLINPDIENISNLSPKQCINPSPNELEQDTTNNKEEVTSKIKSKTKQSSFVTTDPKIYIKNSQLNSKNPIREFKITKDKNIYFVNKIHTLIDENLGHMLSNDLKNDIKSPQKEIMKQKLYTPAGRYAKKIETKASALDKSKSQHYHKEATKTANRKLIICTDREESKQGVDEDAASEVDNVNDCHCDIRISSDIKPLSQNRLIIQPVSPPIKYPSQFSSTCSLTEELSKEEIKKIIEDHRPIDTYQPIDFYKTTKISDRIRQRDQLILDFDSANITPEHKNALFELKKLQMENIHIVDIPSALDKKINSSAYKSKDISSLPYVPKTTMKPEVLESDLSQKHSDKTKYYDHSNHLTKTLVCCPVVQKMNKDCVNIDPTIELIEKANFYENMQKQDQRAKIRGNKALKKTQIQNDYKQLLEELPVLQRQERLAAMRNHNPEFHMTDERLHELERRRQHRIENIFEKYYHKSKTLETPIITIRPIQKRNDAGNDDDDDDDDDVMLPFTALDVSEEIQSVNVGHWKSENPLQTLYSSKISGSRRQYDDHFSYQKSGSSSSANKFEFIGSKQVLSEDSNQTEKLAQGDNLDCKQKCLAELLQRLNKQRELLLQEVQNLPPSSNLQKILHEDTLLHITDVANNTSLKKKFTTTGTSPGSKKMKTKKEVKKRQGAAISSDSATDDRQKKRYKSKEKKKKIIKNECTQTSPNVPEETESPKSTPIKEKIIQVKDISHKDPEKLCEIIIKMSDDSKIKISTQPIEISPIDNNKYEEKMQKINNVPQKQVFNDISSSTSYLSPPLLYTKLNSNEKNRSHYKDILYSKPKQTNIDTFSKCDHPNEKRNCDIRCDDCNKSSHSTSKQKNVKSNISTKIINPQLLNYIKRLLSMSRRSIDELTISTTSDVSSPGPNVVDTQENSPLIQLQNVMNYFNLSFNDIQQQLNNSEKLPLASSNQSDKKKNITNAVTKTREKAESITSRTTDDIDYSDILSKYQEVTRNCVEKISTLTLMIDKIRSEKESISGDLNENSTTSYLELPPQKHQNKQDIQNLSHKNCISPSGGSNKSYSLSQEEIDRYLLEIGSPKCDRDQTDSLNNIEYEIQEKFIPMLQGIPKFNNDAIVNSNNKDVLSSKSKPPASLVQNVHRYNLNIDMTPHELSTIIELDTIVTTSKNISDFIQKTKDSILIKGSDEVATHSKADTNTSKSGFVTISPEQYSSPNQEIVSNKQKKSPRSKKFKKTVSVSPNNKSKDLKNKTELKLSGMQPLSSDHSSSSPENIEEILRTMGLGWAVSTLKKTKEALALSSSSSSADSSLRRQFNISPSDISLKDVLNREFFKKLSSTSLSNSSPDSQNCQELEDISDIIGGPVTENKDRSTQRTSTPVHQSKSTDSKNNLFVSVSDISSVRQLSDENMFLSIPNVSLDTNRSFDKNSK